MDEVAQSTRMRCMLEKRVGRSMVWMTWHQWQETTSSSTYRDGKWESDSSTTRYDETRYFIVLPGRMPDVAVVRRTRIGGLLRRVRGPGTGDAAFDRAFLLKSRDDGVPRGVLSSRLRKAMLARRLPPWESRNSILFTVHRDQPTLATLDSRAAAIAEIAAHLSGAR
ncbi:hypothetical protein [Streptosporangium sp. 'caverna']|uniref:hypothetical protein n=1 Tax=Streptosporangium sp. 'caverna' TaxID=2202249 RepID=UPI0013A6B646|nr:hypothetical protein [Streptosporangium sp. 'caverna']